MKVIEDPRTVRMKRYENQSTFWGRIGLTQSAGSRYENGRKLPVIVKNALVVAYGTDKQSGDKVKELRGA